MPLEGLRAWIAEVERKLGMRTRVFLVLAVIAIGGAGAAVYLAIDARDSSVSESDVQALQEDLEAQIGEGAGPDLSRLEAELEALRTRVEQLEGTSGGSGKGASDDAGGEPGGTSAVPDEPQSEGKSDGNSPSDAPTDSGSRLEELLEQTQERNEQAEEQQGGK
jgi:hypothetical protein